MENRLVYFRSITKHQIGEDNDTEWQDIIED